VLYLYHEKKNVGVNRGEKGRYFVTTGREGSLVDGTGKLARSLVKG